VDNLERWRLNLVGSHAICLVDSFIFYPGLVCELLELNLEVNRYPNQQLNAYKITPSPDKIFVSGSKIGGNMNLKLLYLCGMLVPFVYIFKYVIGGALRPGYSHLSDSVSELLSSGAPNDNEM
jgi:hypothetical protein